MTVVLEKVKLEAKEKILAKGVNPESLEIIELEDIPLSYIGAGATRIRVNIIADLQDSV